MVAEPGQDIQILPQVQEILRKLEHMSIMDSVEDPEAVGVAQKDNGAVKANQSIVNILVY
jgi:hypothetical protein